MIVRENVSSGDGTLSIMIPGSKKQVIFGVVKLQHYLFITQFLGEDCVEFLNQIMVILHKCAERWDGAANKSEGHRYVLSWTLPEIDEGDSERNEQLL